MKVGDLVKILDHRRGYLVDSNGMAGIIISVERDFYAKPFKKKYPTHYRDRVEVHWADGAAILMSANALEVINESR